MLPGWVRQGKGGCRQVLGGRDRPVAVFSPRRLLFALFYFILKSLNKLRAGKGGWLQVPQAK